MLRLVFLLVPFLVLAQSNLKTNPVSPILSFVYLGYENGFSPNLSYVFDASVSVASSRNGKPFEFTIATAELRYYTKTIQNGFFVGGHIGGSAFYLQKYNYEHTSLVQKGYNYMLGASIGYALPLTSKWSLEGYVGGGSIQSFYKGFDYETGIRYDGARRFNKSGEWLPYRLGFNLCYQIR